MELSERRKEILKAIVDDYILTAEPVGSSFISTRHNLGVSPATIRNEMALLEEQGYLDKPHTSAGRVPSYLGYRVYVNELMNEYRLTLGEINQLKLALQKQYLEFGKMISDISNVMSAFTNYTTLVTTPVRQAVKISGIKLISLDDSSFVLIVIPSNTNVKNTRIKTKKPVSKDVVERLSNYLNSRFSGLDIRDITPNLLEEEKKLIPADDAIIDPIFNFILKTADELGDIDVVLGGTTNIFNYPEYNDIERIKTFLSFIKDKNKKILKEAFSNDGQRIKIFIGDDNEDLKELDLSMVVADYFVDNDSSGKIAIIGPTRMDYPKVVSTLDYITKNFNKLFKDMF